MIELHHVTKIFNKGNANEFCAVDDVSLTIDPLPDYRFEGPKRFRKNNCVERNSYDEADRGKGLYSRSRDNEPP